MAQSGKSGTCTILCWVIAIALGLIAVKMTAGGMPFVIPLLIGLVVALVVGMLLTRMFCKGQAASVATTPEKSATQQAAEAEAARLVKAEADAEEAARKAEAAAAAEQAAQEAARQAEEEAARQAAAEAEVAAAVEAEPVEIKSSLLEGQEELAARKGEWKYQADDDGADATPAADAAASAAKEAAPAAAPAAEAAAASEGPDDLKQLKGVGPKLEEKLNGAGVTTFAQIAAWGPEDIAKMDDLLSFKGRIARDGWVEQAKTLAAGEATEFSKRVKDGDVY